MKWKILFIFAAGLWLPFQVYGAPSSKAKLPSLISSLNAVKKLDFCGERVPLNIQEVRERLEKEMLLTLWDRSQVLLWLKRSRRFLPPIEEILKKHKLPDDLKYVAIAESALRPHAGSKRGAIGFWQFMAATGRKYGLEVNERIDERRNVFFSTRAAAQYFIELHRMFGSWTMAAAGYNMGEEGLKAEILAQETDNYYRLYLPLETQRFIFRILAVKLVFADPVKYGFNLSDKDYYPPFSVDAVDIRCPQELPLQVVARAADTYFKMIKDLNPHIRGHYLSKGTHRLHIPKGAAAGFQRRYRALIEQYATLKKQRIYIIKKGDNLSSIAARFNVPLAVLIIWNRLDLSRPIYPGQRLVIYPQGPPGEVADEDSHSEKKEE
jgi:hypothetical protein